MLKTKWNILSNISKQALEVSNTYSISSVVAQVLLNRKFDTTSKINNFLYPDIKDIADPFLLTDMKKAVVRIHKAIVGKEKICVYGDYDVDGISSIVVVKEFLSLCNCEVIYHVPDRADEGYGVHLNSIKKLSDKGVSLIITVDCGSSDFESANFCKENNIDLIITDHHKPGEIYPNSFAFINPHKKDEPLEFKCLAGVGVAYYLIIALRAFLREENFFKFIKEPNLVLFLDLVAFGTVADLVPLTGINRILVKKGLEVLNSTSRQGFKTLKKISLCENKEINSELISYNLAPKINAAGRMGDAKTAVELLLEKDYFKSLKLAEALETDNQNRVLMQNLIWAEIEEKINKYIKEKGLSKFEDKKTLVFYSSNWHQGVLGIIASRVTEKYNKPCIILSIGEDGVAKGSARSINSIDIHSGLIKNIDLFNSFGGHSLALGMSINKNKLAKLETVFETYVQNNYKTSDLESIVEADLELKLKDITNKVIEDLKLLEPYGYLNPYPLFVSRNIRIYNKWKLKEKHLKLKLANNIEAIGFNLVAFHDILCDTVDLLYKPSFNEYNGVKKIQFQLVDLD